MGLKVLHIISGGDSGGAKTHIFTLLTSLAKISDVKLICFIEDTFYKQAVELGIDAEVFEQKSRSDFSVVSRIANLVNNGGYDIVHSHGARANTISFFLKRKIKVPLITTIHSDYLLDFKDNFYKNLVYTNINRIALRCFDYYIAVTDSFKEMLAGRGFKSSNIYTLYNGIDMQISPRILSKDEFAKKCGFTINDGEFLVGQVCRLDDVKNVPMAIRAAKIVIEKRDDVKFLIAGVGQREEELKAMVRELGLDEHFLFLGFVKENYSFFDLIDVNILTSNSESFPYVLLEAAKMKTPSISTKVGGVSRLIEDNKNGFLVDINAPEQMAEKILYLAENRDLLEDMGELINKKVEDNFSSNAMAQRQLEIYEDILKS